MESWGHVRPSIALSTRILSLSPNAVVTLLVPSNFAETAASELKRYKYDCHRLHVVHTLVGDSGSLASEAKTTEGLGQFMTLSQAEQLIDPALQSLIEAYNRLIELQPLTDIVSDTVVESFDVAPSVALIDITLAGQAIAVLPKLNLAANVHVKLLCLAPLSAQWAMWSEVQEPAGKYVGYAQRCKSVMIAPESEREEAYTRWIGENEDVIHIPGPPTTCGFGHTDTRDQWRWLTCRCVRDVPQPA